MGHVDDEWSVGDGVLAALGASMALTEASRSVRTVGELLASRTTFDIVILDIELKDGTSAAKNIEDTLSQGWPVVLFTHEQRAWVLSRYVRAGVLGVVDKMSAPEELIEAVLGGIDRHPYLNALMAASLQIGDDGAVQLPPQEERALTLFAGGLTMTAVADEMHLSVETVKDYLTRTRQRYVRAGRNTATKLDLYARAVEDGYIAGPQPPGS